MLSGTVLSWWCAENQFYSLDEFTDIGLPRHSPLPIETPRFLNRLPEIVRRSEFYLRIQWSKRELRSVRTARLRRLLCRAVSTVPRYRDLGISTDQINEDPRRALQNFPLVEKVDLQNDLSSFVCDNFEAERAFKVTTSGSTGVPLELVDDEDSLVEYSAVYYRILAAYGIASGSRIANIIADSDRSPRRIESQPLAGVCEIARENLLTGDGCANEEAIGFLRQWKPVALLGNPSDLLLLALRLGETAEALPTVKVLLSSGENLPDQMRATIEGIMNCPVREIYSMQECKAIAWQCPEGSFHVNEDRVLVEDVDHSSGQREFVITHFCNLSMPLIRYRTGDLGTLSRDDDSKCPCGRDLKCIGGLSGRDRGFLVTPDERLISPRSIKEFLTGLPLTVWRIVQDDRTGVLVEIAPRGDASASALRKAVHRVVSNLTLGCLKVEVRIVAAAELLGGRGKFQMMRLTAYKQFASGD